MSHRGRRSWQIPPPQETRQRAILVEARPPPRNQRTRRLSRPRRREGRGRRRAPKSDVCLEAESRRRVWTPPDGRQPEVGSATHRPQSTVRFSTKILHWVPSLWSRSYVQGVKLPKTRGPPENQPLDLLSGEKLGREIGYATSIQHTVSLSGPAPRKYCAGRCHYLWKEGCWGHAAPYQNLVM